MRVRLNRTLSSRQSERVAPSAARKTSRGGVGKISFALTFLALVIIHRSDTETRALISPARAQSESVLLTAEDVRRLIGRAVRAVSEPSLVVAITDRGGRILGLFRTPTAPEQVRGNFGRLVNANDWAIALARTGAFFSNDQAPLSSRTVRFISGIHFPPGIAFTPNGALYGIENTNRGCPLDAELEAVIPRPKSLAGIEENLPCTSQDSRGCGLGIATGKADPTDSIPYPDAVNGGGLPIFKNGRVVGGIGVVAGPQGERTALAEEIAFSAICPPPFLASVLPLPSPGVIFLDGIRLPFVRINGQELPPFPTDFRCPSLLTEDVGNFPRPGEGRFVVEPRPGREVPDGWLVEPRDGMRLSRDEVRRIVQQAVATANRTRAAIRLPEGSRARLVIAVGDLDGRMLGVFRMPDTTVFSIDVAVTKARNVVYFSSNDRAPQDLPGVPPGTAVTNRTINFGSQPLYPAGIGPGRGPFDPAMAGPFFELYQRDIARACQQGRQPLNQNQSGIVFFAGSVPLYKNGQLAGGLGISGDGVEQDDYVAAGGARGFEAPVQIRADQIVLRGSRLPYLKFPRNPER